MSTMLLAEREIIVFMSVQQRLKKWREAMKMKQESVAFAVGVARSTYANWELETDIPPKHLEALRKLGFDPELDEPEVINPRTSLRQIRFIINVLASPNVNEHERQQAKEELLSALGLG